MPDYVATFTLLKPVDLARGNGVLLHDMPNRGNNLLLGYLHRPCVDAAPGSGCDPRGAGDALLFREFPVPQSEIDAMPTLKQNPGY